MACFFLKKDQAVKQRHFGLFLWKEQGRPFGAWYFLEKKTGKKRHHFGSCSFKRIDQTTSFWSQEIKKPKTSSLSLCCPATRCQRERRWPKKKTKKKTATKDRGALVGGVVPAVRQGAWGWCHAAWRLSAPFTTMSHTLKNMPNLMFALFWEREAMILV